MTGYAFPYVPDEPTGEWVVTFPPDCAMGEIIVYADAQVVSAADWDTFTRADDPSDLGVTEGLGLTWVQLHAVWGIDDNTARRTGGAGSSGFDGSTKVAYVEYSEADVDLTLDVNGAVNETGMGIAFRVVDTDDGWAAFCYRNASGVPSFFLQKYVAGVATNLIAGASISGNVGTVRVTANGSAIEVFWDGDSMGTFSDSTHSTATKHGMCQVSNNASGFGSATFDNWTYNAL